MKGGEKEWTGEGNKDGAKFINLTSKKPDVFIRRACDHAEGSRGKNVFPVTVDRLHPPWETGFQNALWSWDFSPDTAEMHDPML